MARRSTTQLKRSAHAALGLAIKMHAVVPGQRTHGTTFRTLKVTSRVATPGRSRSLRSVEFYKLKLMCTTECERSTSEDRPAVPDSDVISPRYHDNDQQQQQPQMQLTQARERERCANETVEQLQQRLDTALVTTQELRDELRKAREEETPELQQQGAKNDAGVDRIAGVAQLESKAPVGDLLFAFLSYTLTSTNQQTVLLDSLVAGSVITGGETSSEIFSEQ